jgi:VIT1/CCC1 family predicted Fe2+/Mn2+ transporter
VKAWVRDPSTSFWIFLDCEVLTWLSPEEVPTKRLYISAFTIGMGYLVGGIIPLIPYFFIPRAHVALIYSSIVTGIVLLIFGAVKARVTGAAASFGSYVWGAVSTLLVGGIAAGAAFGIVKALEGSE